MKAAINASEPNATIIRQLLEPWIISFTNPDEADLIIVYKGKVSESKKNLLIPSSEAPFQKEFEAFKLKVKTQALEPVCVAVGKQTLLEFNSQSSCFFGESSKNQPLIMSIDGENAAVSMDIVEEYKRVINNTLNTKTSFLYSLATSLPIRYNLAPEKIRKMYMRKQENMDNLTLCDKLALDCLRLFLVKTIEKTTGQTLKQKGWNGKKFAVLLTHDVDSQAGVANAKRLSRLEQKYDVTSTWYIPSKFCKKNAETIKELATCGEIGAHDTKHDGKLDQVSEDNLVSRVLEAKKALETTSGVEVSGFRAPLLQHSTKIIRAIKNADYTYDSSIPTWEPFHPKTRKAHGIATVYPLSLEGLMEIPITMVQDHQMLRVGQLAPKDTIQKWAEIIETVKDVGGLCTFLIHPDYDFCLPENLGLYEELLNLIACDNDAFLCLPTEIKNLRDPTSL